MRRDAGDIHPGVAGVEGLVHQLALRAAVDRVREIHRETAQIHGLGAAQADLLIRDEGDVNLAVRELRVFLQNLQRRHHVRHGCLVVCSEHGGAVAYDDVLPDILQQFRVFLNRNEDLLLLILADIPSLIVPDDPGVDFRTHAHVHRVHMRDPADDRRLRAFRKPRGQTADDDGVIVDRHVLHAKLLDILREQPRQIPLPGGTRHHG